VLNSTSPPSGSPSTTPKIIGSANPGTTVDLYTSPTCSTSVVGTGSAATLASPGIQVTVPANSARTFYAKATGSIGASTCSSGITYSNIPAPPPPSGGGTTPAPDTSLSAKVRKRKHKATFTFGSSDPSATFMCKLDKRALAPCTSPITLKKLRKGKHTFTVEAVNAAGADPSPASFRFKLKR
jgi:hypothetical protein